MIVDRKTPQAIVVRPDRGETLESALVTIGLTEQLSMLSITGDTAPSIVIAADGPIPCSLLSYCVGITNACTTILPLSLERILPENAQLATADPVTHRRVDGSLSLSAAWADADVRIVVSRVKTDHRGHYALCGVTLISLISHGTLRDLMEKASPHCAIIADPTHDAPMVVADHPLLTDWVGATLMGRNPYSSPRNAAWFKNGQMPRIYTIQGDTAPIASWRTPISLKRNPPYAVSADPVVSPLGRAAYDAAKTCKFYLKMLLDPFLSITGGNGITTTSMNSGFLDSIVNTLSPESMEELLETLIKGLGLFVIMHPGLKSTAVSLCGAYLIITSDNRMNVWVRFANGSVTAGRGNPGHVNVTLIFKDVPSLIRLFSSPKPDLLRAMLNQQIAFDGNLNYLLKLAFLLQRILLVIKGDFQRITST